MKKEMRLVQCTVNGRPVAEYVDVRESLLDMLRNRLGLTSVKKGCEVQLYWMERPLIPAFIWLSGLMAKRSVPWKAWRRTESLQGSNRHL